MEGEKYWAISKDDYRVEELKTEDQQISFMEDQLNYFLNKNMKEEYPPTNTSEETESKEVIKTEKNFSVEKVKGVSEKHTPENQDQFLEDELQNFLNNEFKTILNETEETEEIKKPVNNDILELYNIVDDCEINISEDEILNLLQIEHRWPFRYFGDIENPRPSKPEIFGFDCPIQCLTHRGRVNFTEFYDREGKFIFDEWKKLYDLGFTFMLSDVLDLTPELRNLRRKLKDYTGRTMRANFYLTNGESQNIRSIHSWPPHDHHYSVAVKIVYGTTKWVVGDEIKEFSSGETILIPEGTTHTVVECPGKRLSLTVNLF